MSSSGVTVENAVRAWAKTASGLTDAGVVWLKQNITRPAAPCIELRLGDAIGVGQPYIETSQDLTRPNGTEIKLNAVTPQEVVVHAQAYTAALVGDSTARGLLSKCQAALTLPSVRAALRAAGLVPFDHGKVQDLSALIGPGFEGRAALDIRCYASDEVAEYVGYINSTVVTNPTSGQTFTVAGP